MRWRPGPIVVALAAVVSPAGPGMPARGQDPPHEPPAAPAATVISTEAMRDHLAGLRAAIDGKTIEYRHRRYRGTGRLPGDVPDDGLLVSESRRFITLAGDRFRWERRRVIIAPNDQGMPGDVAIETWDGAVHRRRGTQGGVVRAAIDSRCDDFSAAHDAETLWLGLAGHRGRELRLAELADHPTLHGPFLRHDGRTEWRVQDPIWWPSDDERFRHHLCRVVAERRVDGALWLGAITGDRVSAYGDGDQAMSVRTTAFSREVHGAAVPLARRLVHTDATTWVGGQPFWHCTVIDLIAVRPAAIDESTFAVPFRDSDVVFDARYQMQYTLGGNLIELPSRGQGAILTDEPLRGDVAAKLGRYVAGRQIGELHAALPQGDWVATGTDEDLELPPGHACDLGEHTNMNWGSALGHDFTVANRSDRPVVVTDMVSTGPALFAVQLGQMPPGQVFNYRQHPGGMAGRGTRLEPGESVPMRVHMKVGRGLWRHAVTLVTDSGERWTYQLSATGVIKPMVRTFLRGRPGPGAQRHPAAMHLITAEPEREPLELVGPEGAALEFEEWITLVPLQLLGGAPMQQVAHFTLDLSRYEGERPVAVELRTASGVGTVVLVPETVRDLAGEPARR